MDFKFSKDLEDSSNQAADGSKGNQNALLVLLLVLVGGFAYVYFFTGVIKPLKAQKPAEVQAPQVVKKPIPARDGEPVKVSAAAPTVKKDTAEAPAAKPEPPKAAPVSPAAAPVVKKEIPKPKEEAKKPEPVKPAVIKQTPVVAEKPVAAKAEVKKTAPVDKKETIAKKAGDKQNTAGGEAKTEKTAVKSEKKPVPAKARVSSGRWTLVVGSYQLEDTLAADLVRVRQAGLEALVLPAARKKTQMNRLLLAEFDSRNAAQAELDKIKRHTSDAFIMDQGGKYAVYAGSYLLNERALSEKERLAASGFSLTLKRAEVSIPSKSLSAGTFSDRKAAESALNKLKAAGVKARLVQQ
jgi:cell division protein FtsN